MRAASDPISDLRRAIDCLPVATREAMLAGIRTNPIIVGAYTDSDGGICPMLAAHRNGGRTTFLGFARSWDRFARAKGVRHATRRELAVLEAQLEASLLAEDHVDLKAAIADHEAIRARRAAEQAAQAARPRAESDIQAARLAPRSRIRLLRPRREDRAARRALERVERELART